MKLTMVGTGYVGLVTGTCLANTGNDVVCFDVDEAKIEALRAGGCPIYEPGLTDLMTQNVKAGRLAFTTDRRDAYRDAQMIFICVGTPSDDEGNADLQYVFAVADEIGDVIRDLGPDQDPKIVVVKSTVPVGTTLKVRDRIRAKAGEIPFSVADNPEFLKEGAAINDFNKPDRVVVGVEDDATGVAMRELYEPFVRQGHPIFIMDTRSSEMVKYASNNFLATKISYINEMARLCEAFGADIDNVRQGMCSDKRIGNQFLYPGLGYGGSCFPKDTLACISMGRVSNTPMQLSTAVHDVNQRQRDAFYQKISGHMKQSGGMRGKTLAVWGLAFKPNTDDIREAPALSLIQRAIGDGASIRGHDPVAAKNAEAEIGDGFAVFESMYDALDGADALVICTDWDEFKSPDFEQMRSRLQKPVVFDGRNLYRREQMRREGFTYFSVGRQPVLHEDHPGAPASITSR